MLKTTFWSLLLLCALQCGGCSVFMSAQGQKGTDTSFLSPGIKRDIVIAKLGLPISSDTSSEGLKQETWLIKQGVKGSGGWAVAHGLADVATLGLWEVVGTPAVMIGQGMENPLQRLTVTYDAEERVRDVTLVKEEKKKPESAASSAPPNKTPPLN